jgi:hypothetical protein
MRLIDRVNSKKDWSRLKRSAGDRRSNRLIDALGMRDVRFAKGIDALVERCRAVEVMIENVSLPLYHTKW